MHVLGISAYFHDAAAALVSDGEIVAAAQEERFTRRKHDPDLPTHAVAFCLEQAGLTIADIDHVVFYEKPLRKFERIVVNHLREFPRGLGQFTRSMSTWLGKRLWIKSEIAKRLGCAPQCILFSEHHLSHAASAFLCSPFDDAAVVTVDGVGEWATTTIFHGKTTEAGSTLEALQELHFPHSIGLLYSALTAYLGFEVNEGEFKVMGLSSYGTSRFDAAFAKIATITDDGALILDRKFFAFPFHAEKSFTAALEDLLGPARNPNQSLSFEGEDVDDESQRFADIAASLQRFTETYLLCLAKEAHRLTGASRLCLAGGVALNSVANRRIAEEGPFDEILVHPAAGDAGGALGAALYVSHVALGQPRSVLKNAFLGRAYAAEDVRTFLDDCRVDHSTYDDSEGMCTKVASLLADGKIGGWFQGRFEWGPRSLGARSILADPRSVKTRDRVNQKIKFREPFRPFAPAVLDEDASLYFDLGAKRDRHLHPFMSSVVPATKRGQSEIPAVVHVDGTARVQTVDVETNPALHQLLTAFKANTGVGVLLNTSMNLKGEPICGSPAEAYGLFLRSDLDFLVLEGSLIERSSHALVR